MAHEIKMPQLGLTMEEGTVIRWLKAEGDPVAVGEPLLEISTDKLSNEVEADQEGILLSILAQEGEVVKVQGLLGHIGQPGEKIDEASGQDAAQQDDIATQMEEKSAGLSNDSEGERSVTSPVSAGVQDTCFSAGERIKASPLAKKTAEKMGVDLSTVNGTGPGGRIVQRDVLAVNAAAAAKQASDMNLPPSQSSSVFSVESGPFPVKNLHMDEGDKAERISGMRRVVAERMYASASEIPTVTQNMKVDVTSLIEFRKKINEEREQKFSINDFILKAVAKALNKYPKLLVSLDGDSVIQRAHVNLGMAVALDAGLIVPVIRDADQLGLEALSVKARDLAFRARENQLSPDEYKGSTFTVSNLGAFGVEDFTPIINQPDAAILGVGCISPELALNDENQVTVRQVMRISLTYDHRLIDGAEAAKFQMLIRAFLENPIDVVL